MDATWYARLARAPAWRGGDTCANLHIIYTLHMAIVHISIPYSELANRHMHLSL